MSLRNTAVALLAVVGVASIAIAVADPTWDNARLVGLPALALVATDLLSRNPPRP